MEMLLIVVSVASLAIATAMSVVAWRLVRESHHRSTARVDALETLALESDDGPGVLEPVPASAPAAPSLRSTPPPPSRPARPIAVRFSAMEDDPRGHESPAETDWSDTAVDPDAMFAGASQPPTPSVRWYALVAVATMMAVGAATVYALHTPGAFAVAAASLTTTEGRTDASPPPLELLSLQYSNEAGYFTVSGIVENPAGAPQRRGVVAVIYLFDAQGEHVGNGRLAIDMATLDPGLKSTFVVRVATSGAVARYRVGFRSPEGGVISHIDKRVEPAASPAMSRPATNKREAEGS